MFSTRRPPRRAATISWLEPGSLAHRRRRRRAPARKASLLVVGALALAVAIVVLVVRHDRQLDRQRDAARAYARAWAARDVGRMWTALDPASRRAYPRERFARLVRQADAAAGVRAVRIGRLRGPEDGRMRLAVAVATGPFGTLRGTVRLPSSGNGVGWRPELRLPGLRRGEAVRRRVVRRASAEGSVLDRDGRPLEGDPALAKFAPGLERFFASRLRGTPGLELRFGDRIVAQRAVQPGRSVRSTLRPGLQRKADAALGSRLGGIAVLDPHNGNVLALSGIAVSAPQPPGSTFKIVTASAALSAGLTSPERRYPVQTGTTLSGVHLANASNEACGGTLTASFIHSCNSVFAPLGARVGAQRLVAQAEAFGFNERPRVPVAKPSRVSGVGELRDAIHVGSAAIGQEKDLATPLQMASVAATIASGGVRATPRVVRSQPVQRRRAVSTRVARQVRTMMIGVVRSGTGTAAALPGVTVAGKTGTAELRYTGSGSADPANTDAWFVAFAPARNPRVAVGVMLVGAGAGGSAAAPIARQVLAAALG